MLEKRSSRSPGPALVTALLLQLPALLPLPAPSGVIATAAAATAGSVTGAQKDAALEYLAAVATGDPQQVAFAIHPDDLLALRTRILTVLHEEAKRGDSTVRSRLFGQGMPLAEIERFTNTGFYAVLSDKLYLSGREYSELEGLAAIPDKAGTVEVVVKGRQPRDRGKVQVVNVVTVKPYGKDWKAALPSEIQAQIDDLIEGRRMATATARTTLAPPGSAGGLGAGGGARPGSGTSPAQPGILDLLAAAEKELSEGKCDDYYGKQMSPNFRRVTSKKALEALIAACQNSLGTRTLLVSTLHIVKGLEPHYEYEGQRAVYNLAGQGLPIEEFVLELVDKRWYVAE
jgi:hypothetical protein